MQTPAKTTSTPGNGIMNEEQYGYARQHVGWWRRGGMHVNLIGMPLNIFLPAVYWASLLEPERQLLFYVVLLVTILTSRFVCGMVTPFCFANLPLYFCTSFLLGFWVPEIATSTWRSWTLLTISFALGTAKVGIPMSVCLHRFAAHAAFQCSAITRFLLLVVGCLAHQGGPIWWAATHRAHHKFCDTDRDPHSPLIDGPEKAFGFFAEKTGVLEEFVPRHLDGSELLWLLDTWSFLVHSLELGIAYYFGGHPAVFIAWTSAWMCQVTTLWFNVINHPVPAGHQLPSKDEQENPPSNNNMKEACVASNYKYNFLGMGLPPGYEMAGWYPPFHIFNLSNYIFAQMSAESDHKDHHDNARLAKRNPHDVFYWSFVWPMEKVGIIWNVHKCASKQL